MPRRLPALILLALLSLVALPAAAMEIGPPARNLPTFREDDAGYLSFGWSTDRLDMKYKDPGTRYAAPGKREVERQMAYASFAWLPHDRVEMDARIGVQGMRVGNYLAVDGQVADGSSRMSGLFGGGIRWLAYADPDSGVNVGALVDGSLSFFRWDAQSEVLPYGTDNTVTLAFRYGEFAEARLALPVSKVFRFTPRHGMDTASPRTLSSAGGLDWPFPEISALEVYGGPFARAAYMYGNAEARVGGSRSLGKVRFHLFQDSPAGLFAGLRAHCGRTQRWSLGLEGRYQSGLSVSLLVDASL